jgi:hypothetical protein
MMLEELRKKCCRCGETKMWGRFSPDKKNADGKSGVCKECRNRWNKEHPKSPEVKTKVKAYSKRYEQASENKARRHERARKYHKVSMANDPSYKLTRNYRKRVYSALKAAGVVKSQKTKELFGALVEFVWDHLEKQFRLPMTRPNYGKVWEVDHIRPVSSFDLSDPEQVKACFHYTNLQPLFVEENRVKGNRTPEEWAAYCALNALQLKQSGSSLIAE